MNPVIEARRKLIDHLVDKIFERAQALIRQNVDVKTAYRLAISGMLEANIIATETIIAQFQREIAQIKNHD